MNPSGQCDSTDFDQEQSIRKILDRLKMILRRDLKLGDDIPLHASTPLLGGDQDLDSLDILMLLTSVEREFNIKIPNEEIRRDVFTNLGTLADYIDERRR
jgi:acyl carrier protein